MTYPTRNGLVSNHLATTKEVPLTCSSMVICQSRNGDKEGSYPSVIYRNMIAKNALQRDVGRQRVIGKNGSRPRGMPCAYVNSFVSGSSQRVNKKGSAKQKGFKECAL